jgi:hypothetical protein
MGPHVQVFSYDHKDGFSPPAPHTKRDHLNKGNSDRIRTDWDLALESILKVYAVYAIPIIF